MGREASILLSLFLLTSAATALFEKQMMMPLLSLIPLLALLALGALFISLNKRKASLAFLFSSLFIALQVALFAIGAYPNLLRSTLSPETHSLTLANSAASPTTLLVLTVMAAIGLPFVLGYSLVIYRLFSGKTTIDKRNSY